MAKSISGQNFVPSKPKKTRQGNGSHLNRPMDGRSIVARENVSSLSNVQTSHCEWCRRFSSCAGISCSSPSDWYINPELNASAGLDSGTGGATLETHVGYDFDNGAYIQAGPAAVLPDTGENEVELTGKAGISGGPLYGEILSAPETNSALVSRLVPNSASEL